MTLGTNLVICERCKLEKPHALLHRTTDGVRLCRNCIDDLYTLETEIAELRTAVKALNVELGQALSERDRLRVQRDAAVRALSFVAAHLEKDLGPEAKRHLREAADQALQQAQEEAQP